MKKVRNQRNLYIVSYKYSTNGTNVLVSKHTFYNLHDAIQYEYSLFEMQNSNDPDEHTDIYDIRIETEI